MAQNLHEFLLRMKALFQKSRLDRDMADELAFHQAMLQNKLLQQGVAPKDADAQTRRAFGNTSRWHERLRELWQFGSLENLRRDIGFSIRVLRKSPGFTFVALLTLTARRTSEIGIRMALGARKSQVVVMVFLQNASIAIAGTTLGLVVALLTSKALASFLYGTSVRDPWVFAGSILALALIASAASLLPALRSARINPISAIRCE